MAALPKTITIHGITITQKSVSHTQLTEQDFENARKEKSRVTNVPNEVITWASNVTWNSDQRDKFKEFLQRGQSTYNKNGSECCPALDDVSIEDPSKMLITGYAMLHTAIQNGYTGNKWSFANDNHVLDATELVAKAWGEFDKQREVRTQLVDAVSMRKALSDELAFTKEYLPELFKLALLRISEDVPQVDAVPLVNNVISGITTPNPDISFIESHAAQLHSKIKNVASGAGGGASSAGTDATAIAQLQLRSRHDWKPLPDPDPTGRTLASRRKHARALARSGHMTADAALVTLDFLNRRCSQAHEG